MRGTLVRLPTWMCAAGRVGSRRGWGGGRRSFATKASTDSASTCGGASQAMFFGARAFNQPVAAWDVAQVTDMTVRRRPRRELAGGVGVVRGGRSLATGTSTWCVSVPSRCAVDVSVGGRFQPARGNVGRRQGHLYESAPPPRARRKPEV
jgi:surface protein